MSDFRVLLQMLPIEMCDNIYDFLSFEDVYGYVDDFEDNGYSDFLFDSVDRYSYRD